MMQRWCVSALVASAVAALMTSADAACSSYSTRYGKNLQGVCVCTEASCDSVSNGYLTLTAGQVGVYTTTKAGDRLAYAAKTLDATKPKTVDLVVNTTRQYQKMIGFGGAFTDAAAINIYKLTPALQQKVLDAYYSVDGIQYSVGRIPIASTDFSESVYSYNDNVDDFEMKHFSIDVDRAPNSNKLNLIKRAVAMTSRDLSIFASSWAPPVWMTRENKTTNCNLKGTPGDKYWKALALYYTKALEAFEAEGIKMWGLTVQNEPVKPAIVLNEWQQLRFTPEQERDFIKLDLGPMVKARFPNLKLMAHDDNKADLPDRMKVFDDAEARKYIDGVGIHWYKNLDFFFFELGGDFDKVENFHKKYPELFILATESCEGYLPSIIGTGAGTKIQEPDQGWYRAENYARDMIEDINVWTAGWTDWNLALDTNGGPNWAKNFVDAPILVDEKSGTEFYKQPMYYYMGHLSKFIPTGSVRIELTQSSNKNWHKIHKVAFLTPEQRVVVVLMNRNNDASSFVIQGPTGQTFSVSLPGRGMQTVIFPAATK